MNTIAATQPPADVRSGPPARLAGFRMKVLMAMMLIVSAITALALYFAERNLASDVQRDLEREFQSELDALHKVRELRHVALAGHSGALVRKSRIQEGLEDYGRDLLYSAAVDELRDVMARGGGNPVDAAADALHAQFYRFLDRKGAVIAPPADRAGKVAGALAPTEVAQLALRGAPDRQHIGYMARESSAAFAVVEVLAMPIVSTESGESIGTLLLGFKPFELGGRRQSGIWLSGRLHSTSFDAGVAAAVKDVMSSVTSPAAAEEPRQLEIAGVPHLLFAKRLNPGSQFPLAYEICVFPLHDLVERQRELRWQVVGAGALLLLVGLGASHFASARLSAPVEKLAVDSERSARFSADASHQLKTPVTVLRAGLEELLTRDNLTTDECDQLSALIHQTYRLSSLIEDLLLLSRLDAGRLTLEAHAVDLTQLIEASVDDLSATPDELGVEVETDFPAQLRILGEKRYTAMVLHNLLENARKYNRRGGRIRVSARCEGDQVRLTIGNSGHTIAPAAQAHIFERFHRGAIGENVPGYGLGLNLARELARLHRGDLQLVRSNDDWTEFEVRFPLARAGEGTSA